MSTPFWIFMGALAAILVWALGSVFAFRRRIDARVKEEQALADRAAAHVKKVQARNERVFSIGEFAEPVVGRSDDAAIASEKHERDVFLKSLDFSERFKSSPFGLGRLVAPSTGGNVRRVVLADGSVWEVPNEPVNPYTIWGGLPARFSYTGHLPDLPAGKLKFK